MEARSGTLWYKYLKNCIRVTGYSRSQEPSSSDCQGCRRGKSRCQGNQHGEQPLKGSSTPKIDTPMGSLSAHVCQQIERAAETKAILSEAIPAFHGGLKTQLTAGAGFDSSPILPWVQLVIAVAPGLFMLPYCAAHGEQEQDTRRGCQFPFVSIQLSYLQQELCNTTTRVINTTKSHIWMLRIFSNLPKE